MGDGRNGYGIAALALMATLLATVPVSAQVCGDANDDGAVGVSDGVQALRAAAGLSSVCEAACDLDTSGEITVTDGVNILRKAAGLLVNEACDFTSQEASDVATPSLGLFDGLSKLPGLGGASADAAGTPDCDNPEGTVETFSTPNQSAATFTNCRIGPVILDGTISRAVFAQAVAIGFDGYQITRVKNGKSLTYSGQLTVTSEQPVGRRLAGTLTVVSSERGPMTLQFERVLLVGDSVQGGALIFDLSESDGGRIERMRIEFNTGDEFPVTIELRNGQIRQFILERGTRIIRLPG